MANDAELEFVARLRDQASAAAARLRRNLDRLGGRVRAIEVPVHVDKRDMRNIGRDLAGTVGTATKALIALGTTGPALSGVAAGVSAIGAASAALVSAVGPAVGVVGALPVAYAAAGQAAGVTQLAFLGVADAAKKIREAGGDVDKLKEATKGLTPEARAMAQQLAATAPTVTALQRAAQRGLFPGVSESLTRLTKLAPVFRGEIRQTGTALGTLATQGTTALVARQGDLQKIMRGNLPIIRNAGSAGLSLASALIDVTVAAQPMTVAISRSVKGISAYIADAAQAGRESGRLAVFFDTAWHRAQQLGRIAADVGVAIFNAFKIGAGSGRDLLDTLERGTQKFRDFTESAGGVQKIGQWFADGQTNLAAMARLVKAVADAFGGLVARADLAPFLDNISTTLVPALGELVSAAQRAGALDAMVDAVTAITEVLTAAGQNGVAIGAFVTTLGAVADAAAWVTKNVPGAAAALTALIAVSAGSKALGMLGLGSATRALGSALGGLAKQGGMAALRGIKTQLSLVAQGFRNAQVAQSGFSGMAGTIGGKLRTVATALGNAATATGRWVVSSVRAAGQFVAAQARMAAAAVANGARIAASATANAARAAAAWAVGAARSAAVTVASIARMAAAYAVQAARMAVSAAMTAARVVAAWVIMGVQSMIQAARMAAAWFIAMGPIGWAIAAIIAAVVLIIANWDKVKAFTIKVWSAISDAVMRAVNKVRSIVSSVMSAIGAAIRAYLSLYRAAFTVAWAVIRAVVQAAISRVRAAISAGMAVIRAVVSAYLNAVRAVFSAVWSAIKGLVSGAISAVLGSVRKVAQVVGIVRDAFGRANSAIRDKIGSMVSTAAGIPGKIVGAIGNLGSLLYSKGADVIQGLINGIMSKLGAIGDAMGKVASKIGGFLPGSPVKEGPLRVLNRGYAGGQITRMIAGGITRQQSQAVAAATKLAAAVSKAATPDVRQLDMRGVARSLTPPTISVQARSAETAVVLRHEVSLKRGDLEDRLTAAQIAEILSRDPAGARAVEDALQLRRNRASLATVRPSR